MRRKAGICITVIALFTMVASTCVYAAEATSPDDTKITGTVVSTSCDAGGGNCEITYDNAGESAEESGDKTELTDIPSATVVDLTATGTEDTVNNPTTPDTDDTERANESDSSAGNGTEPDEVKNNAPDDAIKNVESSKNADSAENKGIDDPETTAGSSSVDKNTTEGEDSKSVSDNKNTQSASANKADTEQSSTTIVSDNKLPEEEPELISDPKEDGVFGKLRYENIGNGKVRITGYTEYKDTASGTLNIPSSINGSAVTEIGERAFYGYRGFTGTLVIPDSVVKIDGGAFDGCTGFTGLKLGNHVQIIGNDSVWGAFNNCPGMSGTLVIPDSVKTIGNHAFEGCTGFTALKLGRGVTEIWESAFQRCKGFKGDLTIPDNVKSISKYAFYKCDGFNGRLSIGSGVKTIPWCAFAECSGFTDLNLGSITGMEYNAFGNCSGFKGTLTIPATLKVIPESAFSGCTGFTGLALPGTVTEIGDFALGGCGFTGTLTIPDSVTKLGQSSFGGCNINCIIIGKNVRSVTDTTFVECFDVNKIINNSNIGIRAGQFLGLRSDYFESSTGQKVKYNEYMKKGTFTRGIRDQVEAFVTRLYRVVLEREPDGGGLAYWKAELKSGRKTGADVVASFYVSEEMYGKRISNSKFVDLAYNGIMGRTPDANGKQYWINGLEAGASYDYVASGFIGSQEFTDLCASYGITRGSRTPSEPRDQNIGITGFVSRLYTKALGRGYDTNGLNYWCQILVNNPSRDNLINVAYDGFYHSEELINQNLSNDEYIRRCYRTFLNREAEGEGFNYWKGLLDSGAKTRDDLVRDFAYSQEFSNIMASYGL